MAAEVESEVEGLELPSKYNFKFEVGDMVQCYNNDALYLAKILDIAFLKTSSHPQGQRRYLVHYQGWKSRHDEWVPHLFLIHTSIPPSDQQLMLDILANSEQEKPLKADKKWTKLPEPPNEDQVEYKPLAMKKLSNTSAAPLKPTTAAVAAPEIPEQLDIMIVAPKGPLASKPSSTKTESSQTPSKAAASTSTTIKPIDSPTPTEKNISTKKTTKVEGILTMPSIVEAPHIPAVEIKSESLVTPKTVKAPRRVLTWKESLQPKFSTSPPGSKEYQEDTTPIVLMSTRKTRGLQLSNNLLHQLLNDEKLCKDPHHLLQLPSRDTMDAIFEQYIRLPSHRFSRASKSDIVVGVCNLFDATIERQLLYASEQTYHQSFFEKHTDTKPSQVYGPTHFLRLFVKLPFLLPQSQQYQNQTLENIRLLNASFNELLLCFDEHFKDNEQSKDGNQPHSKTENNKDPHDDENDYNGWHDEQMFEDHRGDEDEDDDDDEDNAFDSNMFRDDDHYQQKHTAMSWSKRRRISS